MDNYETLGNIGEGYLRMGRAYLNRVCSTYGLVIKARHKQTGQVFAAVVQYVTWAISDRGHQAVQGE